MPSWCLYAEIGLEIAVGIDLEDNASAVHLQEIIKRFDACSMVGDSILSKAFKTKLKAVHPDKNIGKETDATATTDLLVTAWGRLKDPTLRRLYDNEMKVKLKVRTLKHANPTYTYTHIYNRYRANRKLGAPHDYHIYIYIYIYVYTHKGLIAKADVSGAAEA